MAKEEFIGGINIGFLLAKIIDPTPEVTEPWWMTEPPKMPWPTTEFLCGLIKENVEVREFLVKPENIAKLIAVLEAPKETEESQARAKCAADVLLALISKDQRLITETVCDDIILQKLVTAGVVLKRRADTATVFQPTAGAGPDGAATRDKTSSSPCCTIS